MGSTHKIGNQKHIDELDFRVEVSFVLSPVVGNDYAYYISNNDEFLEAVMFDVEETSAWNDEGYYTDDDIRLAIGRTTMRKFNIEY